MQSRKRLRSSPFNAAFDKAAAMAGWTPKPPPASRK
jgi:hypothetical protein